MSDLPGHEGHVHTDLASGEIDIPDEPNADPIEQQLYERVLLIEQDLAVKEDEIADVKAQIAAIKSPLQDRLKQLHREHNDLHAQGMTFVRAIGTLQGRDYG